MPSSLIFAALAAAWFAVLVPMIAKRRQEVARIAESALASRVLRRQHTHHAAPAYGQEVPLMSDRSADLVPDERRYRPGRGGFDPEAAALAARARYLARQRMVLGMVLGAIAALVLALVASSWFWWLQIILDIALAAYLTYLRRQVRIEEAVRARRAARMAGSRARAPEAPAHQDGPPRHDQPRHEGARYEDSRYEDSRYDKPGYDKPGYDESREGRDAQEGRDPGGASPPARPVASPPRVHPTAIALDLDDEDPLFDELDPAFEPRYRRAVGE